jgi:hypothetical protein
MMAQSETHGRLAQRHTHPGVHQYTPPSLRSAVELRQGKIGRSLSQNLIGPLKLTILPLQGLHAITLKPRNTVNTTLIDLRALSPASESLGRTAKLGGDRRDAGPLRAVFIHLVKDKPNDPFTHFRRKAFPVLRTDIISRKEVFWLLGAVQTYF